MTRVASIYNNDKKNIILFIFKFCILTAIFFANVLFISNSYAKNNENRNLRQECLSKNDRDHPICIAYCKELRRKNDGDLSTGCLFSLPNAEAKSLRNKACSSTACVYRLKQIKPDLYKGENMIFSKAREVESNVEVITGKLKGPEGIGEFQMQCATRCNPWEYVSGKYKKATIKSINNAVIIRIDL